MIVDFTFVGYIVEYQLKQKLNFTLLPESFLLFPRSIISLNYTEFIYKNDDELPKCLFLPTFHLRYFFISTRIHVLTSVYQSFLFELIQKHKSTLCTKSTRNLTWEQKQFINVPSVRIHRRRFNFHGTKLFRSLTKYIFITRFQKSWQLKGLRESTENTLRTFQKIT